MRKLTLIAALLLAAGCNNGDVQSPQPPPPASDAFYAFVLAQVAASPEDAEGISIDNVATTAPEDSEPLLP